MLFFGKFLVGMVNGIHVVAASVFLSETSPKDTRGRRAAELPLWAVVAYFLSAVLCVESLMGNEDIWNYMFLIPMGFTFICMMVLLR